MLQQVSRSNGRNRHSLNGHASAKLVSDRLKSAPADEALPFRQLPHNLEAEQALLGAILVNNEAMDRVSGFLEPHHFFDPLHQQIFETAESSFTPARTRRRSRCVRSSNATQRE